MKLQELRERLLAQQRPPGPPAQTSDANGAATATQPRSSYMRLSPPDPEPSSDPLPKVTDLLPIAEGLEDASGFEERFRELTAAFESIEVLGQSVAKQFFEPLRVFQEQMAQLARTLEPMRAFGEALEQLARTFEPIKTLHQQVVRIPKELRVHLLRLAKSLEPAEAFRVRVAELAKTFEPARELEGRFAELAEAFSAGPSGERQPGRGPSGSDSFDSRGICAQG
jgi:hypothetical protein